MSGISRMCTVLNVVHLFAFSSSPLHGHLIELMAMMCCVSVCVCAYPTVVVLCMHSVLIGGQVQKLVLETAHDMRLTDGSLMFVPYDTLLYSLPYMDVPHPALRNNSKLLRAYDAVLTITPQSQEQRSFYQAYQQAVDSGELPRYIKPQQVIGR